MKTYFSMLLLFAISIAVVKAQEKQKDTLFFSIDKYYTISPTITPRTSKQTYAEQVKTEKKQMKHTKTNGYVYFIGNGSLIKGLKPKKIMSLKDYIENRKFYFDGTHNKIIDRQKLEDSLINKYNFFFVKGDKFIESSNFSYLSYYPIRKEKSTVYNNIKDTLFFKLDNDYVYESTNDSEGYWFKDNNGSNDGTFFFKKGKTEKDVKLNTNEILSFEKFVHNLKFNDKRKDNKLMDLLSNYILFLVKDKDTISEYIRVYPSIVIE
ncbi:hypothetical protein [Flavobacterium poyangense]|uniref:hypothetical protein n=1 Tax=Flavobacterium poyangense TaxID=2204302 RepID=UPI001420D081|nr:hypothetical protein [Flavobacterium sp. JXAS1]